MKHTPGPWTVAPMANARMGFEVLAPDTSEHADADGLIIVADNLTDGNAYLIAAAPDLLDACRKMVQELRNESQNAAQEQALQAGIAAIAKAEGRS